MSILSRNPTNYENRSRDLINALIISISIILMLYSPRYSVNITFQGAAAKLSYFFRVLFVKF